MSFFYVFFFSIFYSFLFYFSSLSHFSLSLCFKLASIAVVCFALAVHLVTWYQFTSYGELLLEACREKERNFKRERDFEECRSELVFFEEGIFWRYLDASIFFLPYYSLQLDISHFYTTLAFDSPSPTFPLLLVFPPSFSFLFPQLYFPVLRVSFFRSTAWARRSTFSSYHSLSYPDCFCCAQQPLVKSIYLGKQHFVFMFWGGRSKSSACYVGVVRWE